MGGRIATQVAAADPRPRCERPGAARLSAASARAGRRNGATRICRRSAGRCCSCKGAATRSARRSELRRCWPRSRRRRRCTSSTAAITRSRSGRKIRAAGGAAERGAPRDRGMDPQPSAVAYTETTEMTELNRGL